MGETLQDIKAGGCWEWQSSEVSENGAVVGRDRIFLDKVPSALVMPANPFLPPMCPDLAAWGEPLSVIPANSTWKERGQLLIDLQSSRDLDPVLMTSPAADSFKRLAGTLPAVDENGNKIGGSFTHEVSLCTRMPYITFGRIKDRLALKGQRGVHKKHLYVNKTLKERSERNGRK